MATSFVCVCERVCERVCKHARLRLRTCVGGSELLLDAEEV